MERKYFSCVKDESFISFGKKEIERYKLDLYNCQDILPTLVRLADVWGITFKDVIDIVKSLELESSLFQWSNFGNSAFLIHKNGRVWYENKYIRGVITRIPHYENMYVREETYISTIIDKISECILSRFYPHFDIRANEKICEITENTFVSDIALKVPKRMTIGYLASLLKTPNAVIVESKTMYKIYGHSDQIYLPIKEINVHGHKYNYCLYIPIQAIVKKDWSLIENCKVFSIIKPNANAKLGADHDNFFSGLQKDAPYFNDESVEEYKKLFF